jgi:hypothetical protein
MKTYKGVMVWFHPFLTLALDGGEVGGQLHASAGVTQCPFLTLALDGGEVGGQLHASAGVTQCPFDRVSCGFHSRTGWCVEDKNIHRLSETGLLQGEREVPLHLLEAGCSSVSHNERIRSTSGRECWVGGGSNHVTGAMYATWSALCMGFPQFQHSAASFLHNCWESFRLSVVHG